MAPKIGFLALAALLGFSPMAFVYAGESGSGMNVETKSAPWQTLDGKLMKIDGEFYVIEDYNGKEFRLHVSKETKQLGDAKKPGDKIRAEITKSGHALSIQ